VWDKVQVANKLIDEYCKNSNNLYTINFSNSFIGTDGLPIKKLYRDDKLHYNEDGYIIWGNAIKEQVKKIAQSNLTK
jgi:lysophospholipase L1-like esterase